MGFSRSALLQCAPTDRTSICCGGIHMCRTRSTPATPVINQVEIPSCSFSFFMLYTCSKLTLNCWNIGYFSSRFLSCSTTALAVRTLLRPRGFNSQVVFVPSSIRLHVPVPICCRSSMARRYATHMRTSSAERVASMHFLYRVVYLHQDSKSLCGGIPSAHQATTHTTLKRCLYLSYTPREPDALHHSHFASVRPFIRLPACSVICDRILACRRYCKKNSYLRLCFYQRVIGYCRSAS